MRSKLLGGTLIIIGLALVGGACGNNDGASKLDEENSENELASIQLGSPASTGDGYGIGAATVQGDTLILEVSYSGGCEEHDFALSWEGSFLESSPVQANLVLTHDGHGDTCEAMLSETLRFDLSLLQASYQDGYQSESGTILLNIESWPGSLEYTFGGTDPAIASIQLGSPASTGDGYGIGAAKVQGDTLILEVSYSGGCEEHDFALSWEGSFLESNPVQANLVLTHDGHGDTCKAMLSETLRFDLSLLQASYQDGYQSESGTILLNIETWPSSLEYTFGD